MRRSVTLEHQWRGTRSEANIKSLFSIKSDRKHINNENDSDDENE